MLLSSMQRQGNRLILNVSKSPGDNNLFFKYNISKAFSKKQGTKITFITSSKSEQKSQVKQQNVIPQLSESFPLPDNLASIVTNSSFSPHRHRDIMANVIPAIDAFTPGFVPQTQSEYHQYSKETNSFTTVSNSLKSTISTEENEQNLQVERYDCNGPVSLNGVMQSNVPTPFDVTPNTTNDGKQKEHNQLNHYTYLNMPRGRWSQETKFTAQDLQDFHYTMCEKNVKDEMIKGTTKTTAIAKKNKLGTNLSRQVFNGKNQQGLHKKVVSTKYSRGYSTMSDKTTESTASGISSTISLQPLSKRQQLKQAFKEYGAVIVTFHVAISLVSLGSCYALIISGFDLAGLLQNFGWISSSAAFLSTGNFLLAYGIHKLFATVRISITLASAPFIVRYLRSKGFLNKKLTASSSPTSTSAK